MCGPVFNLLPIIIDPSIVVVQWIVRPQVAAEASKIDIPTFMPRAGVKIETDPKVRGADN
jgi:hypothetical protein